MKTVIVDAKALREVLSSLIGPSHYIRELQVIDSLPGEEGSISKLVREFNEAVESDKKEPDLELGISVLDFLRNIHEQDTTPESHDVDELFRMMKND